MTYQQAFRLTTRVIALYLWFWVAVDIIELPRELLEVIYYWKIVHTLTDAPASLHLLRIYLMYLAANTLRIALWLALSTFFYRGGPSLKRFFSPATQSTGEEA